MKLNLPGLYPFCFASGVCANNSRIYVNNPIYVAGFERGVLPIGDWSITMILSIFSEPIIFLWHPTLSLCLFVRSSYNPRYNILFTSVLFPEPDTPVTHINLPNGNSTSMFLRLFSLAPIIFIDFPFPSWRVFGTGIFLVPDKYCPVNEFSLFLISSGVPCAVTIPPWSPAPGPMSITWSASSIVSSSCSTTIKVFPRSLRCFNVSISFILSLWCNPMLGSSKTYKTPTNLLPICVASLIRWASPPDNVPDDLASVK